ANGASICCFEFHKRPFPAKNVVSYEKTQKHCTVPGIIFTTKKGFRFCGDPKTEWVQKIIKQKRKGADEQCCFEFQNKEFPEANIVSYKETQIDCPLPGIIFTTKIGFHFCADPEVKWVQMIIEQRPVGVQQDFISTNKPVSTGTPSIKATSRPAQQGYTEDPGTDTPAPSTASANITQPVSTNKPVSTVTQNIEQPDKSDSSAMPSM
ncbi:C-C motif chemokine 3-like, partial [Clarias magur]